MFGPIVCLGSDCSSDDQCVLKARWVVSFSCSFLFLLKKKILTQLVRESFSLLPPCETRLITLFLVHGWKGSKAET